MTNLLEATYTLFPVLGVITLLYGITSQSKNYVIATLWFSLIGFFLSYQSSGGEILGTYFNYFHAAIYTLNLIILLSAIIYLLTTSIDEIPSKFLRLSGGLLSAGLVTGSGLLLTNLWMNAFFIEDRQAGTPVLQVATFNKQAYCNYKYVFYKISAENKLMYMCPNHYGLVPSIGQLQHAPTFLVRQLPSQLQTVFKQYSNNKNAL